MNELCPIDCSAASLGDLKPLDTRERKEPKINDDYIVIKDVLLPREVAEELRRLGISLNWYSASELADAVIACSYDGQLIDDPEGVSFRDQLQLSTTEKLADGLHQAYARMRVRARNDSERLASEKMDEEDEEVENKKKCARNRSEVSNIDIY